MIKTLSVQNFRSFTDVSVSLGSVNVFVGSNGVGKTNLLETIGVIGATLADTEGRIHRDQLSSRGVRTSSMWKASPVCLSAEIDSTRYKVTIPPPNDKRLSWPYTCELDGTYPEDVVDVLHDYVIFRPSQMQPGSHGTLAQAVLGFMTECETNRKLARVLADLLDLIDWLDDITVAKMPSSPPVSTHLRFHELERAFSEADVGEGAIAILTAAVLSSWPRSPKIFAIDGFGGGLNPRLARQFTAKFSEWCLASGRQAFMTTTCPQVLDGLALQDDRIRLFALDRASRGNIVVKRIEVGRVLEQKETNRMTVSQLWLSGALGGMSNV
jgi:hypothetical protein